MDSTPGLEQSVLGQPLGLIEQLDCLAHVVLLIKDGPSRLNLDTEGAQGMRQHVMDLARDAGPFLEHGRPPLLRPQLLHLCHHRR